MAADVHILTVCTANICRSPAAAELLRRGLSDILPHLAINSAGVEALVDRPACSIAATLIAGDSDGHRSRQVLRQDIQGAELVLALDRSHRSALAQLDPGGRPKTFTLRQAAVASTAVAKDLGRGRVPDGAPPIPGDPAERFAWWVGEIDAMRAFVPAKPAKVTASEWVDPLDVPDPHVVGFEHHQLAVDLIDAAVASLVESIAITMSFKAASAIT